MIKKLFIVLAILTSAATANAFNVIATWDPVTGSETPWPTDSIFVEASDCALVAPMVLNGDYFHTPDGTNGVNADGTSDVAGAAEFTVNVTSAGNYYIWVLGYGADGTQNSFWWNVNGGDYGFNGLTAELKYWDVLDVAGTAGTEIIPLVAGDNTIRIRTREEGIQFFRFFITADAACDPNTINDDGVTATPDGYRVYYIQRDAGGNVISKEVVAQVEGANNTTATIDIGHYEFWVTAYAENDESEDSEHVFFDIECPVGEECPECPTCETCPECYVPDMMNVNISIDYDNDGVSDYSGAAIIDQN